MDLFRATYPQRVLPKSHWQWMFSNKDYINSGILIKDKLVSYYSCIMDEDFRGKFAHTYSSMSHPQFRKRGLYQKTANHLYSKLAGRGCDFAQFFSNARIKATGCGARIATMPTITEEIANRCLDIDYNDLNKRSQELYEMLRKASKVHVTTELGTDITFTMGKGHRFLHNRVTESACTVISPVLVWKTVP